MRTRVVEKTLRLMGARRAWEIQRKLVGLCLRSGMHGHEIDSYLDGIDVFSFDWSVLELTEKLQADLDNALKNGIDTRKKLEGANANRQSTDSKTPQAPAS